MFIGDNLHISVFRSSVISVIFSFSSYLNFAVGWRLFEADSFAFVKKIILSQRRIIVLHQYFHTYEQLQITFWPTLIVLSLILFWSLQQLIVHPYILLCECVEILTGFVQKLYDQKHWSIWLIWSSEFFVCQTCSHESTFTGTSEIAQFLDIDLVILFVTIAC